MREKKKEKNSPLEREDGRVGGKGKCETIAAINVQKNPTGKLGIGGGIRLKQARRVADIHTVYR